MKKAKLFLSVTACAALMFAGCSKDTGNGGEDEPATHTITVIVTPDDGGSAYADMAAAEEGEIVSVTAIANPGFEFYRWICNKVELTGGAEVNPGKFTMPAANVIIKAEFIAGVRINGVVWANSNVDAPYEFAANSETIGMLYQWNSLIGWSSTDPMTSSPAGIPWTVPSASTEEWKVVNDPCPEGWHVPSYADLAAFLDDQITTSRWTTLNGVKGRTFTDIDSGKSIFLPAGGFRQDLLIKAGVTGCYWTTTKIDDWRCRYLYFTESDILDASSANSSAFSIRCIAE